MTQEPPPWGQQPQYPPGQQPPFQQQPPAPQHPYYGAQGYGQQFPPGQYPPGAPQPRPHKPLYARAWFLIAAGIVALIVVLGVVGAATGGGDKNNDAGKTTSPSTTAPPSTAAPSAQTSTSASSPTTSAAPKTSAASGPQIGVPVAFKDHSGTGTITVNAVSADPTGPPYFPPDNGEYLVFDITMACTTGTVVADPLFFEAELAGGRVIDAALGGEETDLTSPTLGPGQNAQGTVSFDVAADSQAAALIYTSGFGPAIIRIPVA